MKFSIYRFNPDEDKKPYMQDYDIELEDSDQMLLDAIIRIKEIDDSLSVRKSCREGVCGSDGMNINGKNGLACITKLSDLEEPVILRPMPGLPVIRDLIVDMTPFIERLEAIKPYIIGNDRKPEDGTNLQTPEQMAKYKQFAGCINCGLCYAACPQFGLNPEFIGPAALTLAHRYNLDSRDNGKDERMKLINGENGAWGCTFVGYCSEVCPKNVDPAAAVNQGKVESSMDFVIAMLKPDGSPKKVEA